MTLRVAADTGGTFTDLVAVDEGTGRIEIAKVPSTPADPSEAVVAGLREVAAPSAVSFFSHGTTVGTNALLEGKGARTALLVTDGFRGVYEVLPQVREYHRLATTVANAYLRPTLGRYLGRLESRLGEAGVRTPRRYVMQSNGGVTTLGRAAERAVATILSGPAAGVIACEAIGRTAGRADLVTFDMGGTSCDVALVRGGRATTTAQTKIAGHDVAVPMLHIHTVFAGC